MAAAVLCRAGWAPHAWRAAEDLPPAAHLICSRYDPQARYSPKRQTRWPGYKRPLTERCDPELPQLMTDVQTTPATTADFEHRPESQADLAGREVLPGEQLVDSGYITARHLLTSRNKHAIDLVGPVNANASWQAQAQQGYAARDFGLDWSARPATCPQGQTSPKWTTTHDQDGQALIGIRFARATCWACSARRACTRSTKNPRGLSVLPQTEHETLLAARARQGPPAFKDLSAARAGIEGPLSHSVRVAGARRARSIGLAKTHLQHLATATALNLKRVAAWLMPCPLATTRTSAFAPLALATYPAT